jgi:hypothetical protein
LTSVRPSSFTKKAGSSHDGTAIKFDTNAAVILNNSNEPITRIFAQWFASCAKNFMKIILSLRGALMAAKLRKGNNVIVLAGKDKGMTGEISSVDPRATKQS